MAFTMSFALCFYQKRIAMKKIIISRKGFDSGSGGCPSPILPDGRLRSLPIPEHKENEKKCREGMAYSGIYPDHEYTTGDIIKSLHSLGKTRTEAGEVAHLDPDIDRESLPDEWRKPGWRGVFGQSDAALGHLENQEISPGDLFLFFGLFRETVGDIKNLKFDEKKSEKHVIWGWLQVDDIIRFPWNKPMTPEDEKKLHKNPWCKYHPHVLNKAIYESEKKDNAIYIAEEKLELGIQEIDDRKLNGYGVFPEYNKALQLTEGEKLCEWQLPTLFRENLTYHKAEGKWRCKEDTDYVMLDMGRTTRWQEGIADIKDKEGKDWVGIVKWLQDIFSYAKKGGRQ